MPTNIEVAKAQAEALDATGYTHPAYDKTALRGILHALLALHEQNEPKTIVRTTKPKETSK